MVERIIVSGSTNPTACNGTYTHRDYYELGHKRYVHSTGKYWIIYDSGGFWITNTSTASHPDVIFWFFIEKEEPIGTWDDGDGTGPVTSVFGSEVDGTSGTIDINTEYPFTSGLTAETTSQTGHEEYLVAQEESYIKNGNEVGL